MSEDYSKYRNLEDQMQIMGKFFKAIFRQSIEKSGKDDGFDFSILELKGIAAFVNLHETYTMSELSNNAHLPLSNMTFIINRLENKGIAKKERDKKDKRVVNVHLTNQGKKMFERFISQRCEEFENTLGKLSEKDQKELFSAMKKATSILMKLKTK